LLVSGRNVPLEEEDTVVNATNLARYAGLLIALTVDFSLPYFLLYNLQLITRVKKK
jgi:hypothetical protein